MFFSLFFCESRFPQCVSYSNPRFSHCVTASGNSGDSTGFDQLVAGVKDRPVIGFTQGFQLGDSSDERGAWDAVMVLRCAGGGWDGQGQLTPQVLAEELGACEQLLNIADTGVPQGQSHACEASAAVQSTRSVIPRASASVICTFQNRPSHLG